ncbi:hypothetical protein MNBD_GAMMA06-1123 [hydrothermal vent metagenome]|uniref:Uncharacterized protein n=1 Tax=hydrothermal vent metagenome TaxID=652676 RepID=A0A3B0WUG9_9ZZZZ
MLEYVKQLRFDRLLLWSYFIWYLSISVLYFDADPKLWFTALGIALIVGIALVLSTTCWPIDVKALDRWQTLRLFLVPFCVSSYSLLIKDKDCFLIFPPDLKTNSIALSAIFSFLIFVFLIKKFTGTSAKTS